MTILTSASAEQVKGTATFLQRIALPPGTVFEARVVDVSRADAATETIGSVRIEDPGNPPIDFVIDVDPRKFDGRARYSVWATISINGRLTLTTDRVYPVLTQGGDRTVELLLRAPLRTAIVSGPRGRPLSALPASFHGDLPCADCEALRYRLNLYGDHSYFLGTHYVGRKDRQRFDIGTWSLSADGTVLTLRGRGASPERFRVVDSQTLRKLATDGSEIVSELHDTLVRSTVFEPIEPRLTLRGMYRYLADAGTFTDCLTGQRWPVASLDDNAALERAYLDARQAPGEELLVSVDGEVRLLPAMEGKTTQRTLVVRRFMDVRPKETCGPRNGTAGLLDVRWVLTALNGNAVAAGSPPNAREASLVLHSKDQRASGFSGCNRIVGGYTLAGDELRFGLMAGTMMACPEGMESEKAFLETLSRVAGWRIAGVHLELLDTGGAVLARFEARPLR